MSNLVLPYPNFINGTPADATQVNANGAAITAWANGGIESGNIGPNGIYATNIIPLSNGEAAFGGASGIQYGFKNVPNAGYSYLRNKIINGGHAFDQRNNGASITPTTSQYGTDQWKFLATAASKFSAQQVAIAPTPLSPCAFATRITSLSAYAGISADIMVVGQPIEANDVAEIQFGLASALPISLSFVVRSSLTGTFAGVIQNTAGNRSYTFSFNIPVANVLTPISIVIPGDVAGAWVLTGSGTGLNLYFDLGCGSSYQGVPNTWNVGSFYTVAGAQRLVGTNAATFDFTAVQLEVGSGSTPFEQRLYGQELALCQRYCYAQLPSGVTHPFGSGYCNLATGFQAWIPFPVVMRAAPGFIVSGAATDYQVANNNGATVCSLLPALAFAAPYGCQVSATVAAGLTQGQGGILQAATGTVPQLTFSAPLP